MRRPAYLETFLSGMETRRGGNGNLQAAGP